MRDSVLDARREAHQVFKHMARMQNTIGESVVWFRFDLTSSYDSVYDEGGRSYHTGVRIPVLWVDQTEDMENYSDTGRRPTQRFRCAVSARSMAETLGEVTEAHGGREWDTKPSKPWWDDRLNDLLWYDGRFYEISNFQIRGRYQEHDVVLGITGIETQPTDERVWDLFPA